MTGYFVAYTGVVRFVEGVTTTAKTTAAASPACIDAWAQHTCSERSYKRVAVR